jgi:hypothetical protein
MRFLKPLWLALIACVAAHAQSLSEPERDRVLELAVALIESGAKASPGSRAVVQK